MEGVHPIRRPHINWEKGYWESIYVFCLCASCDEKEEQELRGKFLSPICDCDNYSRWTCVKCHRDEWVESREYYDEHTVSEGVLPRPSDEGEDTKYLQDEAFDRYVSSSWNYQL